MTNKILDDILDTLEMDEERKKALLEMPTDELLVAIFGIQQYIRGELAIVKKRQINFEDDYKRYRNHREKREREMIGNFSGENNDDDDIPITQKMMRVAAQEVAKAFANRFDVWTYFRDRVLPTLITGFILGLLYLVYGKAP